MSRDDENSLGWKNHTINSIKENKRLLGLVYQWDALSSVLKRKKIADTGRQKKGLIDRSLT
jgi:hypothetical protein